jgi:hypothetical protein
MREFAKAVSLAMLVMAASRCSRARPVASYDVHIRITADRGRPLPGARIVFEGAAVGRSNEQGLVRLAVHGKEGEVVPLTVECPDGFRSPGRPLEIGLRKLVDPGSSAEFAATCQPLARSIVVAVRADNGAGLPVL